MMFITTMGCHIKQDFVGPVYVINAPHTTPMRVIPVYIDDNFTLKDKGSIVQAVKNWNEVLSGFVILKVESINSDLSKIDSDQVYMIEKVYSSSKMIVDRDKLEDHMITLGLANKVGGNHIWIVRDRLGDDDITAVAMHEIGHLLGAEHTAKHLMSPGYNVKEYQCIDKSAVDQVAKYMQIPISKLSYCLYSN